MNKFAVFTIVGQKDDHHLATAKVGQYASKAAAMKAAKKAAHTDSDCVPYGPTSIAFVGPYITAVVSW